MAVKKTTKKVTKKTSHKVTINKKSSQLDFVALGDIVTDAFIQLKDVTIEDPDEHNQNQKVDLIFFEEVASFRLMKAAKIAQRETA